MLCIFKQITEFLLISLCLTCRAEAIILFGLLTIKGGGGERRGEDSPEPCLSDVNKYI